MNGVKQQGYQIIRQVFSGDEIREFGEEADRVAGEAGSVCVRRLMERSSKFAWLSRSARLAGLLGNGMRPVRSILFDKTADANWPVAWHQDLTIAVRGRTTVAWIRTLVDQGRGPSRPATIEFAAKNVDRQDSSGRNGREQWGVAGDSPESSVR